MSQNLRYDRDCHLELALNSNLDRILDSDPDHNPGHNLEIGCDTAPMEVSILVFVEPCSTNCTYHLFVTVASVTETAMLSCI